MSAAPALVIATYRLTFASLFLTPYALWKNRQELKKLSPKVFLWALLSGAFLALHFATWISSLKYINVSSSVVLVALQPVFVALGSFFIFQEKIPLKALLAGMLALSGTFVIGLGDLELGKTALWGDILAVTGAVFAAAYWMVGRSLRQILSLTAYTYVVYTTCALLLFLFTAGRGIPLFGYSARDWLLFLGLALIPTLGGHSSFNWALAYVQSIVVSLAILGEAVGATVLAFLLLGEMPGSLELIGGIIILAGLYLFLINNKEA
jgi:drug/metabolite transporter (DMT)-like permease